MIFGYQIDKDIKIKILEEREAEQLFKLVDSNRKYLAEFLPFVEHTKRVEDSKHFIHQLYNNLSMVMDFIVEYGVIKN